MIFLKFITLVTLTMSTLFSLNEAWGVDCPASTCSEESPATLTLPNDLKDLLFIKKTIEYSLESLDRVAQQYAPVKRYIAPMFSFKDGDKTIEPPQLRPLIGAAKTLKELYKQRHILQKKEDTCRKRMKCPRGWILDLEDEKKMADNLISAFLIQQPILASNELSSFFSNEGSSFNEDTFKGHLNSALAEFYKNLAELKVAYSKAKMLPLNFDRTSRKPHLLEQVIHKYPMVLAAAETYSLSNELDSKDQNSYCRLMAAQKNIKTVKTVINTSTAVIMLASAGAPALIKTVSTGSKVLSSLARFSRSTKTTTALQAAYGMKNYNILTSVNSECRQLNALRVSSSVSTELYHECLERKSDALIQTTIETIGLAGVAASPGLSKMVGIIKRNNLKPQFSGVNRAWSVDEMVIQVTKHPLNTLPKKTVGYQFRTLKDNKTFTYIDLSKKSLIDKSEYKGIPEKYWDYVSDTYSKKLSLTPEEIKEFIDESNHVATRSKLLITSRGPPKGPSNFTGGITIVESKNAKELLPIEIASKGTINLDRHGGKVVEFGRLTVTNQKDVELLGELFKVVANSYRAEDEVKQIYVITSKVHARLYRRFFNFETTPHPNGRDVILNGNPRTFYKD